MEYKFNMSEGRQMIKHHMMLGGVNRYGEAVDINSIYLTRNGKPWIPVMAECHFSRLRKESWEEEILKIKAGSINIIATYIFWIYHEETEGEFNFSGRNDIGEFLRLCRKHGMKAALRIGPWAHGEARNGGFPDWLLKKGIKLRDNNEEYMSLVRRFYGAIYEQVKDYLFYNDSMATVPIIQLENELVDNAEHLLGLKELAKEIGLNVPIYTVTGWNSIYGAEIPDYDVMPVFGGYPEAPWTGHTRKLSPSPNYFFMRSRNDSAIGADLISCDDGETEAKRMNYSLYPFATCELGGGICVTYHRRPIIEGDDVAAVALVKLGCGNNMPGYYMYHGGTNQIGKYSTFNESKATGYPNDYPILSYDFQAPVGEFGLIRPQYNEFRLQHMFINDFAELLAPMDAHMAATEVTGPEDTETLRYSVRMENGGGFVFVNNYQRITEMGDKTDVRFCVNTPNGELIFPEKPITVRGGKYFILPFNLNLDGTKLVYATAQLLCRKGNTYFFFAVDGIETEYVFEDKKVKADAGLDSGFDIGGVRIVTLTRAQALMTYKLDGEIYIGHSCMYSSDSGLTLYSFGNTDLSYAHYTDEGFDEVTVTAEKAEADITCGETAAPELDSGYIDELYIGGAKKVRYWEIKIPDNGFADTKMFAVIDYIGDVAQLYADGELVADEYYLGRPWIVDTEIVRGAKKVIFAVSELDGQDIYFETDKTKGCALNSVRAEFEYRARVKP